jgi:hypothetical protein
MRTLKYISYSVALIALGMFISAVVYLSDATWFGPADTAFKVMAFAFSAGALLQVLENATSKEEDYK